jgi:hypothetical protein
MPDDPQPPLPASPPRVDFPPVRVQMVGYVEQHATSMIFWGFVAAVIGGGFVAIFVATVTGVIANGVGGNHAGVAVGLTTWFVTFALIFRKMMQAALHESRAYREDAYR